MTQVYIPFYFEWADYLRHLPDAEYGKLVKAILAFAMGGSAALPTLSAEANMAYKFITSAINRSEAKRCGTGSTGEAKGCDDSVTAEAKKPTPVKKEKKIFKRIERCAPKKEEKEVDTHKNEEKSESAPTNELKTGKNQSAAATNEPIFSNNKRENTTNPQNQLKIQCQAPTKAQNQCQAPTKGAKNRTHKRAGAKFLQKSGV